MKKEAKKSHKSRLLLSIVLSSFTLIIVWLVTTAGVAFVQGDGTGKFSGLQREVAIDGLGSARAQIDNKSRWIYYWHVENVRPTTKEEQTKYCTVKEEYRTTQKSMITDDPNKARHYTTIVTMRPLLGYGVQTLIFDGCASNDTGSGLDGLRPSN
jgi:hypothetical protein